MQILIVQLQYSDTFYPFITAFDSNYTVIQCLVPNYAQNYALTIERNGQKYSFSIYSDSTMAIWCS